MKVSPELAEILGLLCAEGSHIASYSNYSEKDRKGDHRFRKNKKSERVEFYNKDEKLLCHYQFLLEKEFNYNSKITKHGKINIGTKEIMRAILNYTLLGHLSWKVPKIISESSREVKLCFLRGYFDGDGTASGNVRFFSSNYTGLQQISLLLNDLGFKHSMQGPILKENRKPSYVIQIGRSCQKKFLQTINPVSKK